MLNFPTIEDTSQLPPPPPNLDDLYQIPTNNSLADLPPPPPELDSPTSPMGGAMPPPPPPPDNSEEKGMSKLLLFVQWSQYDSVNDE